MGNVEVLTLFPGSDYHSPVWCQYLYNSNLEADDCGTQQIYLWHTGDYGRLSDALLRVNWEMKFVNLSADLAYNIFLHIVMV